MNLDHVGIFGLLAVFAALAATLLTRVRAAALALWICGFALGGMFLNAGMELLAISQWVISTLVGISFAFFSVMFGDPAKKIHWAGLAGPLVLGGSFVSVLWLGIKESPSLREEVISTSGIVKLGTLILEHHLLALMLLGALLFVVIVGSGVVSRLEVDKK